MPVCVPSLSRRRGTVPAGFSIAFLWLATTMAIAAPAATWSLLPQPADVRLAPSGVVKIVDGALVAVRGADRQQVQPTVDRFMQLVANTRGLQLHAATTADVHPAITFDVDPHASVVGETGYRIVLGAQGIRVIARSPGGAFYGAV
ncbi:MAG TPA: glycoside hydrolase family 20 zincin-like fold domain-containing protein, partial [Mycobacterium sp.]|nr:glycoside hydrolase family 20 zincin-like fold domain-containing protein [Mycobacterium sp.]